MMTASISRPTIRSIGHLSWPAVAAASCLLVLPFGAYSADKPKVTSETDLPQFGYPMRPTARALLNILHTYINRHDSSAASP